jgi:hypothetical protein
LGEWERRPSYCSNLAEALQTGAFRGYFPIEAHLGLARSYSFQFLFLMDRAACAAGFHFSATGRDKNATVRDFIPVIPSFVAKKQHTQSFFRRSREQGSETPY